MTQLSTQGNLERLFENKKVLTYTELAMELGISVSMLRKHVMRDAIPYVKIGKLVRFIPEDIRAWLKKENHAS